MPGRTRRAGRTCTVALLACVAAALAGCDETATEPTITVPVMNDFGTKIVYGTSRDLNVVLLRQHCQRVGGTFNECGTICAPDAPACSTVCAYTCENIPR